MIDLKSTIALQRRVMRCRFSFINFFFFVISLYLAKIINQNKVKYKFKYFKVFRVRIVKSCQNIV
jgi:hypothetical protein